MVLDGDTCVCPAGTFWGAEMCEPCDRGCATCGGSAQNCTSCREDHGKFLQGSSCICPDGEYEGPEGHCLPCAGTCKTCVGNAETCTSCHVPHKRNLVNSTCQCPSGMYDASGTDVCQPCDCPCKECRGSASNCIDCHGKAQLVDAAEGKTCACPNTTFFVKPHEEDGGCGRCMECSTGGTCSTCRDSPRICTSCSGSHFLFQESCLGTCPSNSLAKDNECVPLVGSIVSFSRSVTSRVRACPSLCSSAPSRMEQAKWGCTAWTKANISLFSLKLWTSARSLAWKQRCRSSRFFSRPLWHARPLPRARSSMVTAITPSWMRRSARWLLPSRG
ncbi:unnamed protein product [Effrenium voratum]|uniref:Uncharacterized protein n=1 Tax=Effrenium voratum TaxID=2562239 RepID=A0AA36HMD1_9DINO|nr:unnamed protein product [Effrenium voratum]